MRTLRNILTLLIGVLLFSCQSETDKEVLTGDLYFSFFRFGSYYNQPDSLIDTFKSYFDTIDYVKASEDDKRIIDFYNLIDKNGLIDKPYVDILVSADSVVKLYLDTASYNLIKVHKRKDLQDKNEKLLIKVLANRYGNDVFYSDSLISIERQKGQTLQIQKKFKIEDYN